MVPAKTRLTWYLPCLRIPQAMLDVAYKRKPTANDINCLVTAASHLRTVWALLEAPGQGTPWGHVWTTHLPHFLQRWGTLLPFLCHGFEGRWRDLKKEITLSTHGQWKGAKCGFELVLRCGLASWLLRKMRILLTGRRSSMIINYNGRPPVIVMTQQTTSYDARRTNLHRNVNRKVKYFFGSGVVIYYHSLHLRCKTSV